MGTLIFAALAFVGSHFALSHPFRAPLIARVGPGLFTLAYSLLAAAMLMWLVLAWLAMPPVAPAWDTPEWGWSVAAIVMWAASVLFAGSILGNPALAQPGAHGMAERRPRGMLAITRHPMMWSFALWAFVHLTLAATPANAVLMGSVALLALGGAAGQDGRKDAEMGASWRDWRARTGFVPFSALARGWVDWGQVWPGWGVLAIGTGLWLAASWAHPQLVGVWR